MKLLKIGSAPGCDIVINSEFVSGHHADITLLDSGEIILEDKGSRNGTFVGAQRRRIKPGEEVTVNRGDLVRFADRDLNWAQVPAADNNANYTKIINVGSNFRNDIVVSGESVSRYHASVKVDKSGKVWIVDNGSTNGTEVNGVRIPKGRPVRIKKGDNIVVGNQDITAMLAPVFPKNPMKTVFISFAACLAAVLLGWGIYSMMPSKLPKDSVVCVQHNFNYTMTLKNNPWKLPLKLELPMTIYGTAFFIDKDGHMGTNRHVAAPWLSEYSPEIHEILSSAWEEYLSNSLPDRVTDLDKLNQIFKDDVLGKSILDKATSLSDLNTILKSVHKDEAIISGETIDLYIAYPGRMYSSPDEYERATVAIVSDTDSKDVAIIELNTKKTPEKVLKNYLDINKAYMGKLEPMKEKLMTIGYPSGFARGLDKVVRSMEPTIRESKVAKVPSRYIFELQDESTFGASGSPVFTKDNVLVGVITGGWDDKATTVHVVQARYLKELYDKEVR